MLSKVSSSCHSLTGEETSDGGCWLCVRTDGVRVANPFRMASAAVSARVVAFVQRERFDFWTAEAVMTLPSVVRTVIPY
jgi:hypothetical protein